MFNNYLQQRLFRDACYIKMLNESFPVCLIGALMNYTQIFHVHILHKTINHLQQWSQLFQMFELALSLLMFSHSYKGFLLARFHHILKILTWSGHLN